MQVECLKCGYAYYQQRDGELIYRKVIDGISQFYPHTETSCKRNITVAGGAEAARRKEVMR